MTTPLPIRSDRPIPAYGHWQKGQTEQIRATLLNMKKGQSFDYNGHSAVAYRAASQLKVKIKTLKTNGSRIVWLVSRKRK